MAPCTASRESLRRLFFQQFWPMAEKTETKFSSAPEVMNLFSKKYFAKIEISKFEETHDMLRLCGRSGHTDQRSISYILIFYLTHELSDATCVRCDAAESGSIVRCETSIMLGSLWAQILIPTQSHFLSLWHCLSKYTIISQALMYSGFR